jgi:hypothetical protein
MAELITCTPYHVRMLLQMTAQERERKDCLLLDSITETQEKLQACIIDTFGVPAHEINSPSS